MFKVLYDGIGLYEDAELIDETFSVMLEKDSIIPGTYINDKVVLFGDPYNVYCSAINVEPADHENKNNKTVIINEDDINELEIDNPEEQPSADNSDEFVVVDENNGNNGNNTSTGGHLSEFENINVSDVQTSAEQEPEEIPPPAYSPEPHDEAQIALQIPPPVPKDALNQSQQQQEEHPDDEYAEVEVEEEPVNIPPPVPPAAITDYNEDINVQQQSAAISPLSMPDDDNESDASEHTPLKGTTPKGMPAPYASASSPTKSRTNNMDYNNVHEEHKSLALEDRSSMDDIKLSEMSNNYNMDIGGSLTTGNILEDCDNLLMIYKGITDDREREIVYNEFWSKYRLLQTKYTYDYLKIPIRVRGFLLIMEDDGTNEHGMEPYRRDRIMRNVLSRNGLLAEPAYIDKRYLFSYFITKEIFNYFKWFCSNCGSIRAWMWFFLFVTMITQFLHIGIDFGRGNPWRAVLMQAIVPLTFIASIQFVDTPFTACILRTLLEDRCAALCTVTGRVSLNALVVFFCLGSLELGDLLMVFFALCVAIWSALLFIVFGRLNHSANYVRIATGTSKKLQEKFIVADETKDGILSPSELRKFFKSYNQILSMWQINLMISQYDIHRDGGLRFDALRIWFEKVPLNDVTRSNLLASTPTDVLANLDNNNNQPLTQPYMSTNATPGGPSTGDGAYNTSGSPMEVNQQIQPQYTEAEKEWLGLAGKKYMNQ